MGMFDTIVDANANDWQTKAMGCDLTRYYIGDEIGSGEMAKDIVTRLGGTSAMEQAFVAVAFSMLGMDTITSPSTRAQYFRIVPDRVVERVCEVKEVPNG